MELVYGVLRLWEQGNSHCVAVAGIEIMLVDRLTLD